MGFNFGAFLGGFGAGASQTMRENRERAFKFDMLAEEEATKLRLARAASRREDRAKEKEQAGLLKAMGFSDAKAAWIMKGGAAAVNQYVDYAVAAQARGIDPDNMLDSSLFSSDQQDPRNEAAMAATLGQERTYDTTEPFRIDTEIMTSVLGEIKKPEKPKEYGSLEAGHAGTFSLLQAAKAEGDATEVTRLEGVLKEWQKKIDEAKPEVKEQTSWFNDDSYARIVRDELGTARQDQQFTIDIDGNITSKMEGRSGPAAIAKLNAASSIANIANVAEGVVDERLMSRATKLRNDAYSALDTFGKQVAYSAGEGKDISQFSYFKSKNEAGDIQPTPFLAELQKADRGAYKAGDVVLVQQKINGVMTTRIKVYTGIPVAEVDYQNKKLYDVFHDAGEYITD
jgi:hypothetical protein